MEPITWGISPRNGLPVVQTASQVYENNGQRYTTLQAAFDAAPTPSAPTWDADLYVSEEVPRLTILDDDGDSIKAALLREISYHRDHGIPWDTRSLWYYSSYLRGES